MKQKAGIIMLLAGLTLVITIMESTTAFYGNVNGEHQNTLQTKGSSLYLQELFDPQDYWLPGETKQKELNFGNEGEQNQVIRFRVELKWKDKNGENWIPATTTPVKINWTSAFEKEWTNFKEKEGWYYYNQVLLAGSETKNIMESATFPSNFSNDTQADDFTHATYCIKVYMEGLDVNSAVTNIEWGKTFTGETSLAWED